MEEFVISINSSEFGLGWFLWSGSMESTGLLTQGIRSGFFGLIDSAGFFSGVAFNRNRSIRDWILLCRN
jgi:hypothetical protein